MRLPDHAWNIRQQPIGALARSDKPVRVLLGLFRGLALTPGRAVQRFGHPGDGDADEYK